MEPIDDYIINFLARRETAEDIEKLQKWLDADASHREELKRWLVAWDLGVAAEAAVKINPEDAYQKFKTRIESEAKIIPLNSKNNQKIPLYATIARIAAIFVVSFSLGMFTHNYFTKNKVEEIAYVEKFVPLGSQSEVRLSDGTIVSLNAGSTLRYSTDYGISQRKVYLSGEGHFKVAQQANTPFTVHTAKANITVLGTEFNIRAYPDEDLKETTLIVGKISIDKGADHPIVFLEPGQKLSLTSSEVIITQLDPEAAQAKASWKDQEWRIETVTLQDLAVKLNRRFNVNIQVDERVKDVYFSGTFIDGTLEQILQVVRVATGVNYRIDGRNVFVE